MPKGARKDSTPPVDRPGLQAPKKERRAAKQRASLESKLAAADRLVAKRTAQLEAASAGRASVADQLARLGDVVDPTPGAGAGDAPMAYCMKERTRVTIADPRPIVLANGRRAVSGTCSQCGSRVMRLGAV